ncbi:MAG: hypothetical protein KME31_14500 [Tolypothrix carrinoi HA7290-LM1]|jgi:hypothetical protein|nr:hypothetical protein [Tolypothrix carrinoi HA7290-LM1]
MFNKACLTKVGCLVAIAGALLIPTTAKATATTPSVSNTASPQFLIDWDKIKNWNPSKPGGSFQAGKGTVDINFELGKDVKFVSFENSGVTPSISSVLNGSQGNSDKSLHMQIDAKQVGLTKGNNSMNMTTSFKGFGGSLTGVSFNLFDIDISQQSWQDRVIVKGFLGDQVVAANFTPTFGFYSNTNKKSTVDRVDDYTLDGINGLSDNDNGDKGTVGVTFTSAIDRFELIFTDGDNITNTTTNFNPGSHGIGIGDIRYAGVSKAVPEPTAVVGLLVFGAFGVNSLRKRKQQTVEQ